MTATIALTAVGSDGTTIEVGPSALVAGGVTVTLGLHDGPLAVALADDERRRLVVALGGAA